MLGERQQNSEEETGKDQEDPETSRKNHASAVTIADSPADEVRVALTTQRRLDGAVDVAEGGGVGRVFQGFEEDDALAGGEVEFTGCVFDDVGADYAVDFFAEGLDCDCAMLVCVYINGMWESLHGCLRPADSKASPA